MCSKLIRNIPLFIGKNAHLEDIDGINNGCNSAFLKNKDFMKKRRCTCSNNMGEILL